MVTRWFRTPVVFVAVVLAVGLVSCSSGAPSTPRPSPSSTGSGAADDPPSGGATAPPAEVIVGNPVPPGWDLDTGPGRGYNLANGDYFSTAGLGTSPVLNVAQLVADQKIRWQFLSDIQAREYIGHSIQQYSDSVSGSLGLGVDFEGLLLGAVALSFNVSAGVSSDQLFLTDNAEVRKLQYFIEGGSDPANLEPYLTDSFRADIDNPAVKPQDLFRTYGTHLPYNLGYGGRLSMNYLYTNTEQKSDAQLSAEAQAVYAVIGGSADVSDAHMAEDLEQNSTMIIRSTGGTGAIDVTSAAAAAASYGSWEGTIDADNPASLSFIGPALFGDNLADWALPIWDFATDPGRAKAIEAAFNADLAENAQRLSTLEPQQQYVKDVYVGEGDSSEAAAADLLSKMPAIRAQNQFASVSWDLNRGSGGDFIYLGYTTTTDPGQAVTDIAIVYGEGADSYTNEGVTYKPTKVDLNHGASGQFVWLLYTHDPKAAKATGYVISDIGVETGAGNTPNVRPSDPSWRPIYADLNKGASGDTIFLWYHLERLPAKS